MISFCHEQKRKHTKKWHCVIFVCMGKSQKTNKLHDFVLRQLNAYRIQRHRWQHIFFSSHFCIFIANRVLVTWWNTKCWRNVFPPKKIYFWIVCTDGLRQKARKRLMKKKSETFVQRIKFFIVCCSANLSVNSFSLNEFFKRRAVQSITNKFKLFPCYVTNVLCQCTSFEVSDGTKEKRVRMNLLSFWQMELNQIVSERRKRRRRRRQKKVSKQDTKKRIVEREYCRTLHTTFDVSHFERSEKSEFKGRKITENTHNSSKRCRNKMLSFTQSVR